MARFVSKGPTSARFITESPSPNYDAIIEGICPTDGEPLEMRDDDLGWCPRCGFGWAVQSTGPGTSTLTIGFTVDTSGTIFD